MANHTRQDEAEFKPTRRDFLEQVGRSAVVGGVVSTLLNNGHLANAAEAVASGIQPGKVRHRKLGLQEGSGR